MRHERRGALLRAARAARVPVRFLDWRDESDTSRIPVHRYDTLLEHTVSSLSAIAGAHICSHRVPRGGGAPAAPAGAFPELTEREREILHLLGQGASNAAIAARLGLQTKTAANYVSTIFGTLQVADRVEAMVRAREAGGE